MVFMKAILLCGGKGSRLESIAEGMPKILMPVQGKAVGEHLIEFFKRYGILDVVLAVGYKADLIREAFGDGSSMGAHIKYVEESQPLGTAGALKLAGSLLDSTFIVSNGDELKDMNLDKMIRFHKSKKALATIALARVDDPSVYGVAEMKAGRIVRFVEKPKAGETQSHMINAGLYVMESEVVNMIPEGFCMLERDIFPKIASMRRLYGFPFRDQWFDIGTPERYEKAKKEWKSLAASSSSKST